VRRTQDSFPCATVAEKANFHIVETVGDEFFGSFARVRDHFSFFVKTAVGIYAEEVVGENAFHHGGVAVGDGFGPLALAFPDVALYVRSAGLLRPGSPNGANRSDSNNEKRQFCFHMHLRNFGIR
jgi:hypothetical protein